MAPDNLSQQQENTTGAAGLAATVREPAVLRGPHRPELLQRETLPRILAATASRRRTTRL